jgi:hypothetical protein
MKPTYFAVLAPHGLSIEADCIAAQFSTTLNGQLTPAELEEVRQRNADPQREPGVCATHDFCNADEAMAQAFWRVMHRDIDAANQTDVALWRAAWWIARSVEFRVS